MGTPFPISPENRAKMLQKGLSPEDIQDFTEYWTQDELKNGEPTGRKHWQSKKMFSIPHRAATWLRRSREFKRMRKGPPNVTPRTESSEEGQEFTKSLTVSQQSLLSEISSWFKQIFVPAASGVAISYFRRYHEEDIRDVWRKIKRQSSPDYRTFQSFISEKPRRSL